MPRSRRRFSALLYSPEAEYGPLALRSLLRGRLAPGERLVGWGRYRGELSFHAAALAFALAIAPIGHLLMGLFVRVEKGVMILTDRRLMLLAADQSGPAPDGKGVRADWPLETVTITAKLGAFESLLSAAGRPKAPPAPRDGGNAAPETPVRAPRPIDKASLFIITGPDGRSLTLKVPYLSGNTASGRLREGLVILAGGTVTEDQGEP